MNIVKGEMQGLEDCNGLQWVCLPGTPFLGLTSYTQPSTWLLQVEPMLGVTVDWFKGEHLSHWASNYSSPGMLEDGTETERPRNFWVSKQECESMVAFKVTIRPGWGKEATGREWEEMNLMLRGWVPEMERKFSQCLGFWLEFSMRVFTISITSLLKVVWVEFLLDDTRAVFCDTDVYNMGT